MITLNTDKGLIRVESWLDIQGRPNFIADLNPAEHTLERIIGRYAFKDKIPCGLSNCRTPHAKGYIVVTKGGPETNIGKDCGKTYFGVDFETLSRTFDRDITEKENRETLWSFSFRLEELKSKIRELRSGAHGADWIYKTTRSLININRGCPQEVVDRISAMVKARRNILTIERKATDAEVEAREAISGQRVHRPQYIDEPIATINGLEALYPENDLREMLVLDLESRIKQFESVDIDTLAYDSLRQWVKWVGTVETTMEQANNIIAHGRRLLQAHNLSPFTRVLSQKDLTVFRNFLKGLSQ